MIRSSGLGSKFSDGHSAVRRTAFVRQTPMSCRALGVTTEKSRCAVRLTAHETRIISPVVDLVDEETKVMYDQLEAFCVDLDYPGDSISQKDISQSL